MTTTILERLHWAVAISYGFRAFFLYSEKSPFHTWRAKLYTQNYEVIGITINSLLLKQSGGPLTCDAGRLQFNISWFPTRNLVEHVKL